MKKEKLKKQSYSCQQPTTKNQTQKGITLVALVITIIVLLILAGVAMSMITGQEGLFGKVNNSAIAYEKASLKEKLELSIKTSILETMNFSMTIEETIAKLIEKGYTDKEKAVQMDENQFIIQTTPEGYLVEITKKETDGYDIKVLDKGNIELGAFIVGVEITSDGIIVKEVTSGEETTEFEYYFSIDGGVTWENNEDKTISTYTYGIDKINNASSAKMRRITKEGKIQTAKATEFEYQYTGTYQPFIVPEDGIYQLEVWGAQGGNNGGYGGFSRGCINLEKEEILYINVGSVGNTDGSKAYNGGGAGNGKGYSGDGGGATHIAKLPNVLSELQNYIDDIIIVAGGGGGSSEAGNKGGSGGGYLAANGNGGYPGYGASQLAGGAGGTGTAETGTFGQGGRAEALYSTDSERIYAGGGGGGYFGGGGAGWSTTSSKSGGGGGGSGYIGNLLLYNKVMYGYEVEESEEESIKTVSTDEVNDLPISECAKKGNGYAKITFISN